ncbi:MAG: DUF58 domain-containing protein [Treponema sp.]|nr:DUF58 domain-containing protein [Treponema sp.]
MERDEYVPLFEDSSNLVSRASLLRLSAKSIATSMQSGAFRSLRRGQGIEFSGVREYFIGDDVRTIDWNVTARMNKPYVKIFDEEKEMVVFVLLDRSLSMELGSGKKSRLQVASEAACLLTFAAEQNASPVGLILFDGELQFISEPKTGKDNAMLLLQQLNRIPKKIKAGSVLTNALRGAEKILKKRSLVVILSDFRCAFYEDALASLAIKHDVVAVNLSDSIDTDFPSVGMLPFYDPETKVFEMYPTENESFKKEWKIAGQKRIEKFVSVCNKRGVSPLFLSTKDDPVFVLNKFFSSRRRG